MKRIPFFVVDAFTDTPFQGNPAGVFIDESASLSDEEMRRLAGEVHLESAFLLPTEPIGSPAAADFRVRYFTGVTEVPFCGHDTVAAGVVLQQLGSAIPGQRLRFETPVGIVPVVIEEKGAVTMLQNPPQFDWPDTGAGSVATAIDPEEILAALSLPPAARDASFPIRRVSTGTPWLYVPVTARTFVDATPTDFDAIAATSRTYGTYGIYLFTVERDPEGEVSIWSRCYAPIAGLNEDPVTGSASGALGGYLADAGVLAVPAGDSATVTACQGFAGGRGGSAVITVSREADGSYARVAVTGRGLALAQGTFQLP